MSKQNLSELLEQLVDIEEPHAKLVFLARHDQCVAEIPQMVQDVLDSDSDPSDVKGAKSYFKIFHL